MASSCPGTPSPAGLPPPSVATPGEPLGEGGEWTGRGTGTSRCPSRSPGRRGPTPPAGRSSTTPATAPTSTSCCAARSFAPALLRPLHATAQAAMRKRHLERLALSYARARAPGPAPSCCCPAPPPPSRSPRPALPATAPPGWPRPRCCPESQQNK
uniref:Uncharacterized protein n=1 Tax=Pan paniscus TaxID=9597 RepID=A0A2R9BDW0_PANPA